MNKFYRFKGAYKRSAIIVDTNIDYDGYEAFLDLSILSDEKIKFSVSKGKKLFDIIQFRYEGFNILISKHFKDALEKNNISGWKTHQVKVDGLKEKYYVFHVSGRAGKILNLDKVNTFESATRKFDIETWDGSDIFILKDTANIVCTERIKIILEEAKITNLEIEYL